MGTSGINGLGEITKLIDKLIQESMLMNGGTYQNGNTTITIPSITVENSMASKKTKKSNNNRKSLKKKKVAKVNPADIEFIIEQYLKLHPEILDEYIKNYLKKNIKVDWKSMDTNYHGRRYALAVYDNGELISRSDMCLTIPV